MLRELFERTENPYAGGDLAMARRLGAAIWAFASVVVAVLLVVAAPDRAIGPAGWAIAAVLLAAGALGTHRLADGSRALAWNELLAMSYVAIAQIALLQWLAGDGALAYAELYVVVAIFAGAMHPPRRVVVVLATATVASALPLAFVAWDAQLAAQTGTRVLLFWSLGLVATALMKSVRAQRVGLRERGERAEVLARVDTLTELPNRRAFEEALATEISRARRTQDGLCLVIADVDRFKLINDGHGHVEGDTRLRDVADALRHELRQHDSCFRWGGDEFALLLPDTTRTEADAACERLMRAVATRCLRPDGSPLTVACAAAQLTEGMTGVDLIRAAFTGMRARKGAARLRLVES